MAYILGHRAFYGHEFLTDKRALIPRPETELLVERALERLKHTNAPTLVWDVGTGSGAIATTWPSKCQAAIVPRRRHRSSHWLVKRKTPSGDRHIQTRTSRSEGNDYYRISAKHISLTNLPYLTPIRRFSRGCRAFEPARALFTRIMAFFCYAPSWTVSAFHEKTAAPHAHRRA
jgi:release factor glutamine methyltransferase